MSAAEDRNDMAFWWPMIENAAARNPALRVPTTRLVLWSNFGEEGELRMLLGGDQVPRNFDAFIALLDAAADGIAPSGPVFLRTGHTSGKHAWRDNCYVAFPHTPDTIAQHVCNLVEWSEMVDLWGLPVETWVVRRMLTTEPLFCCKAWGDMPVVREFRVFVSGDLGLGKPGAAVTVYPYWPEDAFEGSDPDAEDWQQRLAAASKLTLGEHGVLTGLARLAWQAVGGGGWSVDFLYDKFGFWWLTDMAEAERSYRPTDEAEVTVE